MKNLKDTHNDLMGRREIEFSMTSEKNPGYSEISKKVSEHFKVAEDQIMVEQVRGAYGSKNFKIKASIYGSKEAKDDAFKRLTKQKKVAPGAAPAPAA